MNIIHLRTANVSKIMRSINVKDQAGKGMISTLASTVVFVASVLISNKSLFFKMNLGTELKFFLAGLLFLISFLLYFYAVMSLPLNKLNKELVTCGPYKKVRHPRYAAIIFFIFPALAIIFSSGLSLLSTIFIFFIFRHGIKKEEIYLLKLFGEDYKTYMSNTPRIIPKLLVRNFAFFY